MNVFHIKEVFIDYKLICPKCDDSIYINQKQFTNPRYIIVCRDCGYEGVPDRSSLQTTSNKPQQKKTKYVAVIKLLTAQGFDGKKLLKLSLDLPDGLNDAEAAKQLIQKYV